MAESNCIECNKSAPIVKGRCPSCYRRNHQRTKPEIYKASRKRNMEAHRERTKNWRKKNKGKVYSWNASRRVAKKLSTSSILFKIFKKEVGKIFQNCPPGFQVDHIIPLKNELVCGLHVPWNLQYLTLEENSLKRNLFDGTLKNEGWRIRGF